MTSHDSETFLDVEGGVLPSPQVTLLRRKVGSSQTGIWRVCGALLAVALCAAAAVCFTLNKSQNNHDEGNDLKHTLRQFSENGFFTGKDAIHLTGDYDPKVSNESLVWKDDQDQAFFAGGLKLRGNEIIIPHSGIYFVYSQVSFHVSCDAKSDHPDDLDIVHLSHAVSRYSKSYDGYEPLFSAMRSACVQVPEQSKDSSKGWYNAIYLGAAFRLNSGDKLRTDMEKNLLPHIESGHGKTFFGAFAL